MPNISVRLSDEDIEILDQLVVGVRAYYLRKSETMPTLRTIDTTRSSALRHLLAAWKHGMHAAEEFKS